MNHSILIASLFEFRIAIVDSQVNKILISEHEFIFRLVNVEIIKGICNTGVTKNLKMLYKSCLLNSIMYNMIKNFK